MKVRLAVQIFSQSVADALNMLSTMNQYPQFRGADETAEFLRVTAYTSRIYQPKNTYTNYHRVFFDA